jgi:hypothetical protein
MVSLTLYDILGRQALTLADGFVTAGYHQVELNASRLASGVYLYRLVAGSFTAVNKMLLLR